MDGRATPVQVSAYLAALRAKGESVEEIVGTPEAAEKSAPAPAVAAGSAEA